MTAVGTGTAGSVPGPCPEHGEPDSPDHRYCEACGRELDRIPLAESTGPIGRAKATEQPGAPVPVRSEPTGDTELSRLSALAGTTGSSGATELSRLAALAGPTESYRPVEPVSAPGPAGPASWAGPTGPTGSPGTAGRGLPSAPITAPGTAAVGPQPRPTAPGSPVGRGTPAAPAAPSTGWSTPPAPSTSWSAPAQPVPSSAGWGAPAHGAGGQSAPDATPASWLSSRAAGQPCPGCGTPPVGNPGLCAHCGQRWLVGRDRADLDLGPVAAVTDRARRRRNEDAVAIGRLGQTIVAVVCDGVSTSLRADVAAHAATEAALTTMLSALSAGGGAPDAIVAGGRAAAVAARATAASDDGQVPPSCTFVAAVITTGSVTVGWIGDSRAYWLGPDGAIHEAVCLTVDDSVVGQIRAGRPVPPGAELDPTSKALIRWLGADSSDTEPQIVTFQPNRPGRLVICSDGLSHYLPNPAALAARVPGPGGTVPIAIARDLTRFAIEAGGHDNVAVAVLPFPPIIGPGGPDA